MKVEEKETEFDKGDVRPIAGGCWFCWQKVKDGDDAAFDIEFDTYYHKRCLEKTSADSILEHEKSDDADIDTR